MIRCATPDQLLQPSRLSGLSGLPVEILSLILSNFCLHCREPHETPEVYTQNRQQELDKPSWYSLDLQALYSSCLVSRRLCQISQPILYHAFVPAYGDSWRSRQYSWSNRLSSFLRTVVRRPDLAAMVQRFFLSFYFRVEDIEDEAGVVLEEVARARDIDLSSFLRPFQDIWTRETRACYCPSTDELAAMLLSCLPNLSTLYLSSRSPWSAIPKSALSAAGVSNLSLRTIDVCGDQYDAHYRLSGILEMSASTLRTLNIDLYDSFDGRGMSICPLPNLRSISLTRSTISEPDLEALLSCCIGLEVFVHDAISDRDHILLSDLIRCLSKHKETLTTLHLNIRNVHVPNWDVLPSLRDFPILRAVLLNSAFIYHNTEDSSGDYGALTQLLPSSIVSLRLEIIPSAEICGRLARGLFGVSAATWQGRFPRLKMVKCYTAERLADDDLSEKFASTGVDFTYDARPDNSLFNL